MSESVKTIFISHGGGPLPLLGDEHHAEMVDALKAIARDIPRPNAIIVVSAHWEAPVATVTAAVNPNLIYDYSGFPEASYDITYPCAGSPELAQKLHQTLTASGLNVRLDTDRGLDHGAFVPLKIMYPEADIPSIQLSLLSTLDARSHIELGEQIRKIDCKNILVIGSGFSFHNMRAFFTNSIRASEENRAFEKWLQDICVNPLYSESQRRQKLINWTDAPSARFCHPREEHLLPLHICYGIAQAPASAVYSINILNKKSSLFIW